MYAALGSILSTIKEGREEEEESFVSPFITLPMDWVLYSMYKAICFIPNTARGYKKGTMSRPLYMYVCTRIEFQAHGTIEKW
jgi:hypothetical protein